MMAGQELSKARRHEEIKEREISPDERPLFHLSARTGWMNDPNGFSVYGGEYHLFYQYYPYKTKWGPMHWGHAVSHDLVTWQYKPAVLAPDTSSDSEGCFSGSAITLKDGRHMLMYTGVLAENKDSDKNIQVQCLAFGDGNDYEKYSGNPILTCADLPEEMSNYDFRDPKINQEEDGTYTCVICGCTKEHDGRTLYFRSDNGINWKFESVLASNDKRFGTVWECPDFFMLDGKAVLLCSPMSMLKTERYSSGNGTLCLIGEFDRENSRMIEEYDEPIDNGIDFYATQTLLSPDGRRIMTAWMQNWDALQNDVSGIRWFGQLILPRELSVRNGKLYQQPIRELEQYRKKRMVYKDVHVSEKVELPGIFGRAMDISLRIRPDNEGYQTFEIKIAENEDFHTSVIYDRKRHEITLDRSLSGIRKAVLNTRTFITEEYGDEMDLRMILDRYSLELFVNGGEQAASITLYTDLSANRISFQAEGSAVMDIESYILGLPAETAR